MSDEKKTMTENRDIVDPDTGEILDDIFDAKRIEEIESGVKTSEKISEPLKAIDPVVEDKKIIEGVVLPASQKKGLVTAMASRWSVAPEKLMNTLKQTAFKQKDGVVVSDPQMMALLIVCNEYDLNPFLKQIYAFPDNKSGGIVPIVGIDGWCAIASRHPLYDSVEFKFSEKMIKIKDSKECPEWCEAYVYRKGSERPIVVREYLDEVYRELSYSNPWKTHTKRMLRHKTYIQALRIALGLTGIYDEDEAERIVSVETNQTIPVSRGEQMTEKLRERKVA
jgi:phage recombination protein Bet